jgi:AcrR family transcriptional regulator
MAQTSTRSHKGRAAKRKRAAHLGPERRRPEVLDAALELFLEHGYEGTSMQAVAEQAGVTKPVVYACFPSKEKLFRALLRREEERILGEINAAFADADLDDVERTLKEGFSAFLHAVAASPDVYRLIFFQEGGGNAAIANRIQRAREAQVEALTNLARRWLATDASGSLEADRDATARLLGRVIVGLAEAGARTILSEPKTWTPDQLGAALGRLGAAGGTAL